MKRLILALLAGILCPCYALCDTKIEAESAAYVNCKLISDSKYSGGKALELTESNAKITFTHQAAERGKCDVYVGYDGLYGGKKVNLAVNGNSVTFDVNGWAAYSGIQSAEVVEGEGTAIYDLQGRQLTGVPARGLYISDGRIYSAGVK